MEQSDNSKEFEQLYLQVCKILKRNGNSDVSGTIPSREKFSQTLKKFIELMNGHKSLLNAIGRL